MPRAHISERLLALFTPRERAAAMVGDLLELYPGRAAFSFAVARMLLAMSWRLGLGFLLAAAMQIFTIYLFNAWAARPPHGVDGGAVLSGWWFGALAAAAVFSLVRFGASGRISRLSVALTLLTGLDVFFWWTPFVRPASRVLIVLVLAASCLTRPGRSACLRLFVATVGAVAPMIGMVYVVSRATAEQCRRGCTLDVHNAPIILLFPAALLVSSAAIAGVLNRRKAVA